MDVGERRKFLMKEKLCFGSYKPIRKGNSERNCLWRITCCMCKENHRKELHGYKSKSKQPVARGSQSREEKSIDRRKNFAYASTNIHEDVISMCVV